MSNKRVQPIRLPKANATKEQIMQTVFPPMVKVDEINRALDDIRHPLFQAMSIVRMASHSAMEPGYAKAPEDVSFALDVVHDMLSRIVDRTQSTERLLADEGEVPHGEY